MIDTLPAGLSYHSVVAPTPPASVSGQTVSWSGLTVPANGTRTLVFRAQVVAAGSYVNVFVVGDANSTVTPPNGSTGVGAFSTIRYVYMPIIVR